MKNVKIFANQALKETESTNDRARELGRAGLPHGTWVSADRQTKGRGRHGRTWESDDGNLFLSLVLRVEDKKRWPWLPLLVGVACVKGIQKLVPDIDLKVKWPNDLILSGKKVGGILCETDVQSSFVIAGLGLNVRKVPEEFTSFATSLADSGKVRDLTLESLRSVLVSSVTELSKKADQLSEEEFKREYDSVAFLSAGTKIFWLEGEEKKVGEVLGLGHSGELLVSENGTQKGLFAEEVHLVDGGFESI